MRAFFSNISWVLVAAFLSSCGLLSLSFWADQQLRAQRLAKSGQIQDRRQAFEINRHGTMVSIMAPDLGIPVLEYHVLQDVRAGQQQRALARAMQIIEADTQDVGAFRRVARLLSECGRREATSELGSWVWIQTALVVLTRGLDLCRDQPECWRLRADRAKLLNEHLVNRQNAHVTAFETNKLLNPDNLPVDLFVASEQISVALQRDKTDKWTIEAFDIALGVLEEQDSFDLSRRRLLSQLKILALQRRTAANPEWRQMLKTDLDPRLQALLAKASR